MVFVKSHASFLLQIPIYLVEGQKGATNMKKLIAIVLLLTFILVGQAALAADQKDPLDIPIKQLYSAPAEGSNLILDIPIDVKLLDISEDGNWYKVRLSYGIGPFNYTYVGWTNIPVAEILAKREKASEIAYVAEE